MTYPLTLRKEAEHDIGETFEHYQQINPELGREFIHSIELALEKVRLNPLNYRMIYKDLRRIPIKRFPYRIFYKFTNTQIVVIAVLHIRRDPTNWAILV